MERLYVGNVSVNLVIAFTVQDHISPLVNIRTYIYSSYPKLLEIVCKILLACSKFKGCVTNGSEIKLKSFDYLVPCVQRILSKCFRVFSRQ